MALPGWGSLTSVVSIHSSLEGWALVFFALLVVFDVWAHLDKKHELILERVGLICFGDAILAEILAYPYSRRNEFLSNEAARDAERRIALLNKEAGDARKDAGTAIEDAAKANERAGKAVERAARADERASENDKQAAVLRDRATKAELQLAKIRTPRQLAADEAMVTKLKSLRGTPFQLGVFEDTDSVFLAASLMGALLPCGWSYVEPPPNLLNFVVVPLGDGWRANKILGSGVSVRWFPGQYPAVKVLDELFSSYDIRLIGLGSGMLDEVVPVSEQCPMQINIGQKDVR